MRRGDLPAALSAVVLAMACTARPVGDGEPTTGSSGAGASATAAVTETTSPPTTGDASSSSGCVATTGVTEDVVCPDECSLAAAVCGLALGEFEDCGSVELGDDAATWSAVHECALAAVSEGRTFVAITAHFNFDSTSYWAHVGQAGCPYAITEVTFDDDPCGGLACEPAVWKRSCAGLSLNEHCIGVPDEVCFNCDVAGETIDVCGGAGG